MKFNDYQYIRPNLKKLGDEIKLFISSFPTLNGKDQIKILKKVFTKLDEIESMYTIASIRNSINTQDKYYEEENEYLDANFPQLVAYLNQLDELAFKSEHKEELIKEFGEYYFVQIETKLKTFDEKMIPLMVEESNLSREYNKLIGGAQIDFDGKINTLPEMGPYLQNLDRNVRHQAQLKVSSFFSKHEEKLDNIYDRLVKIRDEKAKIKGYENFIELGYYLMGRTDYNSLDVKKYRDQIKRDVVPVVTQLNHKKRERLAIEDLKSYDTISFLSGNPTPKGTKDELINVAKEMYQSLSKETNEFFNFMLAHDLFDLDSKPGKAGGGYCTYIAKYEAPFIFANFNGTAHDVDVLTHEAGHAFQVYSSKNNLPSQRWPGSESAEIHSMSMEFFAWPWVPKFFKEDATKYYFTHLVNAISFLPYGALVDEFQHEVYANPNLTPNERKSLWRKLEKEYLPDKDYGDDDFMDKGTYWYKQGHIFDVPFYYIDYTLAQVVAFQFWVLNKENPQVAWQKYYHLCKLGGSKGFSGLIKEVDLMSPFIDGTIRKTIKPLLEFLKTIDDRKL